MTAPMPGVPAGWEAMSAAERDAAYNNAAAVADAAGYRARRTAASVLARGRPGAVLDAPYGPRERNRIDLFPAGDPAAPCLVFIFGGYWQMNSQDSFAAVADGVRAHGWSAALPGYTLAPEATLRGIVGEIDAALDWLSREGKAHGIAGRLVVSGWSAGGHLAAIALEHPAVTAGLALSGIFELAPLRETYLNEKLRLTAEEIAQLSPLRRPVSPKPLVVAYGEAELPALVQNSRDFHACRTAAGAPGALLPLAGHDHFSVLEDMQRADGAVTRALLALAAGD